MSFLSTPFLSIGTRWGPPHLLYIVDQVPSLRYSSSPYATMLQGPRIWTFLAFLIPLVTSHVLLKRAPVVIGYRTVDLVGIWRASTANQNLANANWQKQINQLAKAGNTLFYDPDRVTLSQTGKGSYLSPKLGDWAAGTWCCAILADSAAWDQVNKAWMPPNDCDKPLWWDQGGKMLIRPVQTPAEVLHIFQRRVLTLFSKRLIEISIWRT